MSDPGMSYETKLFITVVLLFFAYPVGVFFMYRWMKWSPFVKTLISLPIILVVLGMLLLTISGIYSLIK